MPGVNAPSGDYFTTQLQNLRQEIDALASQQTWRATDKTGLVRTTGGLLPNGDFGILLTDAAGNQQELLPAVSQYVSSLLSTTSSSYATIGGSPAVTVTIGASGDCNVTTSCSINVPTGGGQGGVSITANGGTNTYQVLQFGYPTVAGGNVNIAGSVSSTIRWSQLTGSTLSPGSHTFGLYYISPSGTTSYGLNFLSVQPI